MIEKLGYQGGASYDWGGYCLHIYQDSWVTVFEEIFRMTGISFVAIINKLEKYDEFVKVKKIVNVSTLKLQLESLQNQDNNRKKSQFKKKEWEVEIKTPFLGRDFKTITHSHSFTHTTQISDLFIISLSTPLVPNQTTQVLHHHFKFLNSPFKIIFALFII